MRKRIKLWVFRKLFPQTYKTVLFYGTTYIDGWEAAKHRGYVELAQIILKQIGYETDED